MGIQGFNGVQKSEKTIETINAGKNKVAEIINNLNNAETEELELEVIEKFESAHPKQNEEIMALEEAGYKKVYDEVIPVRKGNPPQEDKVRVMLLANENGETEKRVLMVNKETNTYEPVEIEELDALLDLREAKFKQEYENKRMRDEMQSMFEIKG